MVNSPRYANNFLKADLKHDQLYRIGALAQLTSDDGEALFEAPLLRQVVKESSSVERLGDELSDRKVYFRTRFYTPQVFRIQMSLRPQPFCDDSPMLQWSPGIQGVRCDVAQSDEQVDLIAGATLGMRAAGQAFAPVVTLNGRTSVQFQTEDHFTPPLADALPFFCLERGDGKPQLGFSVKIEQNEHFCGTGERFSRIDLFGRQIELVNEDAHGVTSLRAYKNIPFLLSSRPYGLFAHSTSKMRVDIGYHSAQSLQWLVEDDVLDLFVIGGDAFGEILHTYRSLTGFPQMPPLWSYGTWMSRMTYWSAEQIKATGERLRRENFPMDVLHIDTAWFPENWKCDWQFSTERFPEPEAFFDEMLKLGFRVTLWQWPYVQEDLCITAEALAKRYVGISEDVDSRRLPGLGLVDTIDFTNPEADAWYRGLLRNVLKKGAAAIKADFGEWINESAQYHNSSAAKYRNLFSLLYQQAVWEVTKEVKGDGVIWARSGWAGSQRYPVHWGGDCPCSFAGLAGSIQGGLHLGLSGFAFWSHDCGGFYGLDNFLETKPAEELYARWTQVGTFTSHMRYHGTTPREPWEYPGVQDIVRQWLRLRYALLPYLISQSEACCTSGKPFLRALPFEWRSDPTVWAVSDQYLFGDNFLVAPILNREGVRHVYLPEGAWVDFWSGEQLTGPQWLMHVQAPLEHMPLYVKADSVVEFAEPVQCTNAYSRAKHFQVPFDESYRGLAASELGKHITL